MKIFYQFFIVFKSGYAETSFVTIKKLLSKSAKIVRTSKFDVKVWPIKGYQKDLVVFINFVLESEIFLNCVDIKKSILINEDILLVEVLKIKNIEKVLLNLQ